MIRKVCKIKKEIMNIEISETLKQDEHLAYAKFKCSLINTARMNQTKFVRNRSQYVHIESYCKC